MDGKGNPPGKRGRCGRGGKGGKGVFLNFKGRAVHQEGGMFNGR
jgi:hypothetical protein